MLESKGISCLLINSISFPHPTHILLVSVLRIVLLARIHTTDFYAVRLPCQVDDNIVPRPLGTRINPSTTQTSHLTYYPSPQIMLADDSTKIGIPLTLESTDLPSKEASQASSLVWRPFPIKSLFVHTGPTLTSMLLSGKSRPCRIRLL